jgi:DNA-binding protein HU-beta
MNRAEFVTQTAAAIDQPSLDVDRSLSGLLNTVRVALSNGESVKLAEFGTFKVVRREQREGINPRTQERMTIPAHNAIVFIPSYKLKALVN